MRALFNPVRFGVFSFQLIMHKLLRFLTPVFLIAGLIALTGLAILGKYQWLFLAAIIARQWLRWSRCAVSRSDRPNVFVRLCHLLYYYIMANYALVLAWRNVCAATHDVVGARANRP